MGSFCGDGPDIRRSAGVLGAAGAHCEDWCGSRRGPGLLLEAAAANGWLFGGVRVTLITTLSALTIAILTGGAVREHG
jgi:hypothetical protein